MAAVGVREEEVIAMSAEGEESAEGTRRIDVKRQDQTPSEPASAGHAALTREETRPVVRLASARTVVGEKEEEAVPENAAGSIDGGDGLTGVEKGNGDEDTEGKSNCVALTAQRSLSFGFRRALGFILFMLFIIFAWQARMLTSRGNEAVGDRDVEKAHQPRTNSHARPRRTLLYYRLSPSSAWCGHGGSGGASSRYRIGDPDRSSLNADCVQFLPRRAPDTNRPLKAVSLD